MTELTVFSTIGVRSAAEGLFHNYEKSSGVKLSLTWGTAPMLVKRLEAGETADVLVLSRAGIEALKQQGKVVPGSEVALASSGVAIAVKQGAPKPDISTPEAFKETLLACKSIACSEPSAGGASGVYFAKLIERMGIAEQLKPKIKYPPPGGFCAALLMTGEAELALQQKPELLHIEGSEIVGMLPGDLNLITEFVAGIMPVSKNVDAAKALIEMLQSPAAKAVFQAKGLEPA